MAPIAPYRAFALGFFRSSVFFFLAAGLSLRRHPYTIYFSFNRIRSGRCELAYVTGNSHRRRPVCTTEFGTTRCPIGYSDRIRDKAHVDVQEIFEGTVAARKDIENYLMDQTVWYNRGWFEKTALGIGSFLWMWISYGILLRNRQRARLFHEVTIQCEQV
jgi:hypothetical protein